MTEKKVTLDSLYVDAIFVGGDIALRKFDDDMDTFVKKLSSEVDLVIADALGTLFAAKALARRTAIDR